MLVADTPLGLGLLSLGACRGVSWQQAVGFVHSPYQVYPVHSDLSRWKPTICWSPGQPLLLLETDPCVIAWIGEETQAQSFTGLFPGVRQSPLSPTPPYPPLCVPIASSIFVIIQGFH